MITIIASFELKPECVETFKELAAECIEGSRREEGNADYNLYVSKTSSTRFFFIENWKDEKAIELHNATPHFQKFSEGFGPLLAGEPTVEVVEKV
ncbi:MAG: antibiotic biosynthesis monooxygenase [Parasporobacterium sp.]|nr:antibiotic biosynthesis monooxygenase [Parasporobacterium sp.]